MDEYSRGLLGVVRLVLVFLVLLVPAKVGVVVVAELGPGRPS